MKRHVVLRRLVVGVVITAAALVGVLAVTSAPADAHATPVSSEPANGAELASAPEQLTISFNEPPEMSVSTIQLVDASGEIIETGEVTTVPGDNRSMTVPLEGLEEGSYTAGWRVVSQVDGHPTTGAVTFGVGVAAAAAGATVVEVPPLSLLETAGRLTLFTGLVPLVGVASVVPFAFGALVRGAHRRLAVASGVVAVVGLVLLALAQNNAAGAGFGKFLGTSVGQAIIWRGIGLLVMAIGLIVALRSDGRVQRIALAVTGLAAAGAVAAHVATGHAAATSTPALEVASQWIHVIAIGVWIGGLAVLLAGLRGLSRDDRGLAARRFSLLAAIALAVVVLTGTLRTVSELDRVGDLWGSDWGRGVLAKIVGVAVLAGLGAVNRYRHVPIAARSTLGLRRLGRGELMFSVVILGAAAVVASTAPPNPPANGLNGAAEPVTVSGADATTSVRAELTVDPAAVGTNELSLRVVDFDTAEPFSDADVSVRFAFLDNPTGVPESQLDLVEAAGGTYRGEGDNLSVEGTWEVTALVQRDDFSAEVPLEEFEVVAAAPAGVDGTADDDSSGDPPGRLVVDETDPNVTAVEDEGVTKYEIAQTREFSQEGDVIQVWFEPPLGGVTELNVAFVDANGEEIPMTDPVAGVGLTQTVDGDVASGDVLVPPVTRNGAGAGFATVELPSGIWQLQIEALSVDPPRPLVGQLTLMVE